MWVTPQDCFFFKDLSLSHFKGHRKEAKRSLRCFVGKYNGSHFWFKHFHAFQNHLTAPPAAFAVCAACAQQPVQLSGCYIIHVPSCTQTHMLFVDTLCQSVSLVCTHRQLKIDLDTYEFPVMSRRILCGHSRFWLHSRPRELNIARTKFRAPHFPTTVVQRLIGLFSSGSVSLEQHHHA